MGALCRPRQRWPNDTRLLLFLGSSPYERECGRAVWSGHRSQSLGLEGLWGFGGWDCCVIVTERATDVFETHPSFVAWILGHELCHALTALRDPVAHAVAMFVQENIVRASGDHQMDWFELPHEDICDRFGRHVAEQIVGAERFRAEIDDLASKAEPPMGTARLCRLFDTTPLSSIPPLLPLLRDFAAPYSDRLRARWDEDSKRGDESYVAALDPELLF